MSDGVPSPVFRPTVSATRAICLALASLALSACGMLRTPAPITEAEVEPVETAEAASAPAAASEPASAPQAASAPAAAPGGDGADNGAPRKQRRETPRPRAAKPATPPPPPAPPPLFMTRTLPRDEVHMLLDSGIQKRGGKVVGRAIDMVVDANGTPLELIVNLQGFLGVGDRKLAFPWQLFRFTPGGKNQPILLDAQAAPTPAPRPDKLPGATATRLPLIDATVVRSNGTPVGRVVDALIDRTGQPQALVLDLNGLIDQRHAIVVNWSPVRFGLRDGALHAFLDLNEAQLKNAPVYENDKPIVAISPPAPTPPAAPAGARR